MDTSSEQSILEESRKQLDRTIRSLSSEGGISNRGDILIFLLQQGYEIIHLERLRITVSAPGGERITLEGGIYSVFYSRTFDSLYKIMMPLFWLMGITTIVSRHLWMVLFENMTGHSRESFWNNIHEAVKININMWGYNIPAIFFSITCSIAILILTSEVIRQLLLICTWGYDIISKRLRRKLK